MNRNRKKKRTAYLTPKTCSVTPIFGMGRLFNLARIEEDGVKHLSMHLGKWIFELHYRRANFLVCAGSEG